MQKLFSQIIHTLKQFNQLLFRLLVFICVFEQFSRDQIVIERLITKILLKIIAKQPAQIDYAFICLTRELHRVDDLDTLNIKFIKILFL
jgi:hypothetical protein